MILMKCFILATIIIIMFAHMLFKMFCFIHNCGNFEFEFESVVSRLRCRYFPENMTEYREIDAAVHLKIGCHLGQLFSTLCMRYIAMP